jgi:MFS family permease
MPAVRTPLLPVDGTTDAHRVAAMWPAIEPAAAGPLRSFAAMSVAFSLCHGCVTALIPLASIEFGTALGATSVGTMYVLYTLTAMVGATLLVGSVGPKWGLVLGLAVFCVYVASFLLAATVPALAWAGALGGAAVGGVGGGVVWTAQGAYFSFCSARYAAASGTPPAQATAWLGSAFASCYLGAEILLKLLSSLLMYWPCREEWRGNLVTGECPSGAARHGSALGAVFTVYVAVACTAAAAMTCVADVREAAGAAASPAPPPPPRHWSDKSLEALRLMRHDRRVLLLSMLNLTFGFSSAFVNTFLTGVIIPNSLGADKVGYLVAVIPLTATLLAMPIAVATKRLGSKTPAMVFGGLAYLLFYLPFAVVALGDEGSCASDSRGGGGGGSGAALSCVEEVLSAKMGRWSVLLPLLVLNGAGRAVWCARAPPPPPAEAPAFYLRVRACALSLAALS